MKIVKPNVKLIHITTNAAQLIEVAGRICWKSEDKITKDSAGKFISRIVNKGHHSVLEHATATFHIITDRGISHELVRHRLASYSQSSTRYCNYSRNKFGKEITVIKPSNLSKNGEYIWKVAMKMSEIAYFLLLKSGAKPETARSVLPTCLQTELIMTANFREWKHIIDLRTSKAAHPDIRIIANMIRDILVKECPEVFDATI